jgi:hypothetical protein
VFFFFCEKGSTCCFLVGLSFYLFRVASSLVYLLRVQDSTVDRKQQSDLFRLDYYVLMRRLEIKRRTFMDKSSVYMVLFVL